MPPIHWPTIENVVEEVRFPAHPSLRQLARRQAGGLAASIVDEP
jgi:hypothetical protein